MPLGITLLLILSRLNIVHFNLVKYKIKCFVFLKKATICSHSSQLSRSNRPFTCPLSHQSLTRVRVRECPDSSHRNPNRWNESLRSRTGLQLGIVLLAPDGHRGHRPAGGAAPLVSGGICRTIQLHLAETDLIIVKCGRPQAKEDLFSRPSHSGPQKDLLSVS